MRKFKYLGPDTERYKKGQVFEYDGQNAVPDGGVLSQYWEEVGQQTEVKEAPVGRDDPISPPLK